MILCDVAREDASVIVSDLKELEIDREGSIAMEDIDSLISEAAERAEKAAAGFPSDAVVWEEVEARTSENTELSASYLLFMVLACLIASVGIMLDSPILIIGAMVVGPEFGPIAGVCVAAVQRRGDLLKRSLLPLLIGFPARDHRRLPVHPRDPRRRRSPPKASPPRSIRTPTSSPTPTSSRSSSPSSRGPPECSR